MPDFSPCPINTDAEVNQWLKVISRLNLFICLSLKLSFASLKTVICLSLKPWFAVLRDGRPPQCALRLCLKVVKSIFKKGMLLRNWKAICWQKVSRQKIIDCSFYWKRQNCVHNCKFQGSWTWPAGGTQPRVGRKQPGGFFVSALLDPFCYLNSKVSQVGPRPLKVLSNFYKRVGTTITTLPLMMLNT